MNGVTLTGNDITFLDGRLFVDFADGDVVSIEFPNELSAGKTGKNGNTIIAANSTGRNATVSLRLLKGSPDDKYLNSRLQEYINDSASFVVMSGEFIKRAGDGKGNVNDDIYKFKHGVFSKIPSTKDNAEGDTEQSVTIWNLNFYNANRSIA